MIDELDKTVNIMQICRASLQDVNNNKVILKGHMQLKKREIWLFLLGTITKAE